MASVHGIMKIPTTENTSQRFSHFQVRKNFMGMGNAAFREPLTNMTAIPIQK
jgi:hypothetical protein